jgi:hypothetical protein
LKIHDMITATPTPDATIGANSSVRNTARPGSGRLSNVARNSPSAIATGTVPRVKTAVLPSDSQNRGSVNNRV